MAEPTRQSPARQGQPARQTAGRQAAAPALAQGSPEQLAYRLMLDIARNERSAVKDRKWILDTFAECLLTIRNPADRAKSK
jgi:hypothetical protein